ncbi:hypothetical protein ABBQ38_005105 [Trebouxia sp. C0009 RCD-2024]
MSIASPVEPNSDSQKLNGNSLCRLQPPYRAAYLPSMVEGMEEFQDFTVATHWERSEAYTLAHFVEDQQPAEGAGHSGQGLCSHYSEDRKIPQWFALSSYITLEPNSYSKRILNPQDEASALLSALATALSNCRLTWPAFLPVHDPLRDACWGIAISGLGTIHYDSDSTHSSSMWSPELLQTEGQLHFFSQQLLPHSLAASQACVAAASSYSSGAAAPTDSSNPWRVTMSRLRSYKLPRPRSAQGADIGEPGEGGQVSWHEDWAAEAPWDHWANYEDPVGDLELDVLWSCLPAQQVAQGGGFTLSWAASWRLHALTPGPDPPSASFYTSKSKVKRRHLRLDKQPALHWAQPEQQQQGAVQDDTFTSMLTNLVYSRTLARTARAVGDLASSEWWVKKHVMEPEPSPADNLQRVLADLFLEDRRFQPDPFPASQPLPELHLPKTAPSNSLLRFVRHLREACWDTGCLLPRMDPPTPLSPSPLGPPEAPRPTGGDQDMSTSGLPRPDFSCCLLHQKLQMLNLCIHQAHRLQPHQPPQPGMTKPEAAARSSGPDDMQASNGLEGWDSMDDMEDFQEASSQVDGVPPSLYLLAHPAVPINVPDTQDAPAMTEDMLLEKQAAMAALDDSTLEQATRARLQGGGLLQADMAAFKAANPTCQLADFVRWHSPKDWHPDPTHSQGGSLSERMSHEGNVWQQLWHSTAGRAARDQEPLMNAEKEAERVFHDLEQVPPAALWDQLLALAAVAAASMLAACQGASLLTARHQFLQFQQDTKGVLTELGSSLLQGTESTWAGSPRGHPRRSQTPFTPQSDTEDEDRKEVEAAEAQRQHRQAESLLQPFQQLEQFMVAGESLCRRLPGCPDACSKLLQAALQMQDAAGGHAQPPANLQHPDPDLSEQAPGNAQTAEAEQATVLQPPADLQQGESSAVQAGVQVIQQERAILDVLMLDKVQLQGGTGEQCRNPQAWEKALRTEWATECSCTTQGRTFEHCISHRLYVQTAPGEMRLATTMITQV